MWKSRIFLGTWSTFMVGKQPIYIYIGYVPNLLSGLLQPILGWFYPLFIYPFIFRLYLACWEQPWSFGSFGWGTVSETNVVLRESTHVIILSGCQGQFPINGGFDRRKLITGGYMYVYIYMVVGQNVRSGGPQILVHFDINHPFWPIAMYTSHIYMYI